MKQRMFFGLMLALWLAPALPAQAQTSSGHGSLFSDSTLVHGIHLGITGKYGRVLDTDALLFGGNISWTVNGRLGIGLAGYGLSSFVGNTAYADQLAEAGMEDVRGLSMRFGYGGLLVEPVLFHRKAIHLTIPVLLGAGGLNYGFPRNSTNTQVEYRPLRVDGQAFYLVEPGVELGISLMQHLRLGFGMSYLYTSELDMPETAPDALHGAYYRVTIKAGVF